MNRRETGTQYEERAAEYLIAQNYQILERNYRIRSGEIDIIARDGTVLVFIEVKYRKNDESGNPLEAVDIRKQRKIIKVARYYLYQKKYGDVPCRFDVIGICGSHIEHIKDAFWA
ncbi:YraN family protein [Lachnospiraceae bacterium OF09-6]|nr:YraN family protein [Lachnospiraceae bacterium]MCQ4772391.1 YraN family protein [Lacrimispora saccharolytica]RGD63876.1 YraN family protein [Lachnospiraceae bacterium OF09-6]